MAEDNLKLGIDIDDASLQRARKRLDDIEKAQNDLRSSFLSGAKNADAFSKELSEMQKEATALNKALDALEQPRTIDVQAEKFDRTSRDVALAGDAESNLRTLGGFAGSLGGGGIESAVGRAAEIPAAIEALPRAVEAFKGLPAAASAAASAIGTSTGGLVAGLGAAAIAVGVLSYAVGKLKEQTEKEVSAIQASVGIIQDVNLAVAQGLTSDDAARRMEEINREIDATLLSIENVQAAQQNLVDVSFGGDARKALNTADYKEFDVQIESMNNTVAGLTLEQRKLEEAQNDGRIAANDAAQAERDLASERTQGVLNAAQQEGELIRARQEAAELSREENQQRAKQLEQEQERLRGELAVLRSSGDTSEQVASQIQSLEMQIASLGQRADVFKNATGKAADSVANAAKKMEESATRTDAASSRSASRAGREKISSAATIGGLFGPAGKGDESNVLKDAEDSRKKAAEIEQQYLDNIAEQQIKFNEDREREARRADFELAKIGRDAKRAEEDATRERNFAAAADVREDASDRKKDLKDQLAFEAREREIAFRQEQAALRRDSDIQLRELQNSFQQRGQMEATFQQSSLNGWAQYFNRLAGMQTKMTGTGGQSSGGNQSLSMNALSYIQG
jgi:hypothetical protein